MSLDDLAKLLEMAKRVQIDPAQAEAQRRSFAFGTANIENSAVTIDMIDSAAIDIQLERERIARERKIQHT